MRLFKAIAAGKYEAYTSDAVLDELEEAPDEKRVAMLAFVDKYNIRTLIVDEKTEMLVNAYLAGKIVPRKYKTDGIHLAVAAVNDMDFIVSLNFRHIVSVKTKRLTHEVNIQQGCRPVEIVSPMEMIRYEKT